MPLRSGRLTPQERTLAKHYAATGDVAYASERAGYAFATAGHKALRRPSVRDQVAEVRERYAARGVGVAFRTLIEIAEDRDAGKMPRVSASDKLLKAAGLYSPAQAAEEGNKELHELSIDALRAKLGHLLIEGEAVETPVDVAAIDPLFG